MLIQEKTPILNVTSETNDSSQKISEIQVSDKSPTTDNIDVGDLVILNIDAAELKKLEKSEKWSKISSTWSSLSYLYPMLGKTYSVKSKFRFRNDDEIVALPSPNGSGNLRCYFPKHVLKKVQCK